jgi:ATP-dependent Clp protease adaptor protein ClpS
MGNNEQLNPRFNEWMDSEVEKPYHLILHNDEHNTFEYVIDCLVEICQHETYQAEQCALITHHNGKCDIKGGELSELALMKDKLTSKGLTVTID